MKKVPVREAMKKRARGKAKKKEQPPKKKSRN
jgi:hypothetical protein